MVVVNSWLGLKLVGTATVWVLPFGNTTVAVTPAALLGPLLVMLTVTVIVWPGVAAPCGVSVIATSALLVTTKAATAAVPFVPTDVAKAPTGMVLVNVPEVELVNRTVTVQEELGAISDPVASTTVFSPIVAVAVPGLQLVAATELKLTRPGGYVSVNGADKVADTSACVLVIVIVRRVVPPAEMLDGENVLEINGLEGVTASISDAEQTPLAQPVAVFVLVTLAGGEITAVLVTCVCPIAMETPNPSKQTSAARDI